MQRINQRFEQRTVPVNRAATGETRIGSGRRRAAAHYPISQYLRQFFEAQGIRVSHFVKLLGYRSVHGGINSFDAWLKTGQGDPLLIARLNQAFPGEQARILVLLAETEIVLTEEARAQKLAREQLERKQFKPYLFLETEMVRPTSVAMFALTGGRWKFIVLPEHFRRLSKVAQLAVARAEIARHQLEQGGYCLFFGPVIGYRLVPDWDQSILLSPKGEEIAAENQHFEVPFATYYTFD